MLGVGVDVDLGVDVAIGVGDEFCVGVGVEFCVGVGVGCNHPVPSCVLLWVVGFPLVGLGVGVGVDLVPSCALLWVFLWWVGPFSSLLCSLRPIFQAGLGCNDDS